MARQLRQAESGAGGTPEYAALSRRGTTVGIVLAVLVVVIVFLMVNKPAFW